MISDWSNVVRLWDDLPYWMTCTSSLLFASLVPWILGVWVTNWRGFSDLLNDNWNHCIFQSGKIKSSNQIYTWRGNSPRRKWRRWKERLNLSDPKWEILTTLWGSSTWDICSPSELYRLIVSSLHGYLTYVLFKKLIRYLSKFNLRLQCESQSFSFYPNP